MSGKEPKEAGFLDHFKGTLWTMFRYATVPGIIMGAAKPGSLINGAVGLNEGVKDVVRDAWMAGKFIGTAGDMHATNTTGDKFEQWWRDKVTKNVGLGQYEFRMGAGWELPKGVKYNGVVDPSKEGKKITGLDAVFVRDKQGNVEVLDRKDPRYADMVLPYIATQVAAPSVAGKAMAALKVLAGASQVAEIGAKVSKGVGTAGSAANTAGMLGFAGTQVGTGLILKPQAINDIARILDNPADLLVQDKLRERMNTIFHQFSFTNGPLMEQNYIPPLSALDNPIKRLEEMSKDTTKGAYVFATPFDRLTDLTSKGKHYREEVRLENVRMGVRDTIDFQKSFYNLAAKALSGPLSQAEMVGLRFGMNVMFNYGYNLTNSAGKVDFTAADQNEVTTELRRYLSSIKAENDFEKTHGDKATIDDIQAAGVEGRKNPMPIDEAKKLVTQKASDASKAVADRDAYERQKLMAQSMAFAMH